MPTVEPHLRPPDRQQFFVHKFKNEITCSGNAGGSTLQLTPKSVHTVRELLGLNARSDTRILWIGCGEGAEVRNLALQCPLLHIDAIDILDDCIEIAKALKTKLENDFHFRFPRLRFACENALTYTPEMLESKQYSCVYTTAVAGDAFYDQVYRLCLATPSIQKLVAFETPFVKYVRNKYPNVTCVDRNVVHLSGSNEQRAMCALRTTGNDDDSPTLSQFPTVSATTFSDSPTTSTKSSSTKSSSTKSSSTKFSSTKSSSTKSSTKSDTRSTKSKSNSSRRKSSSSEETVSSQGNSVVLRYPRRKSK